MRVDAIGVESAVQLAAQISYAELKGINGNVAPDALGDNSGVRYLRENNYRGVDLYEVTKALQLSGKNNKILLLQLLERGSLLEIISLLDKALIINGLRFMSKEKLLRLMMILPKMVLFKMLLQFMDLEMLIKMLPMRELFSILRSNKLTNRLMLQGFYEMNPKFLMQLIGHIMNREAHGLRHSEMMQILFTTKKHLILDGMRELPYKALVPFVTLFVKENPELLENVSRQFLFKMFSQMPKPMMLQALHALPKELLMEVFVSQMADKFLVLIASQIDEKTLSEYLISSQPQLLAMLAGGMAA